MISIQQSESNDNYNNILYIPNIHIQHHENKKLIESIDCKKYKGIILETRSGNGTQTKLNQLLINLLDLKTITEQNNDNITNNNLNSISAFTKINVFTYSYFRVCIL